MMASTYAYMMPAAPYLMIASYGYGGERIRAFEPIQYGRQMNVAGLGPKELAVLLRREWWAFIQRAQGAKVGPLAIPARLMWARPFREVRAFRAKLIDPGWRPCQETFAAVCPG